MAQLNGASGTEFGDLREVDLLKAFPYIEFDTRYRVVSGYTNTVVSCLSSSAPERFKEVENYFNF